VTDAVRIRHSPRGARLGMRAGALVLIALPHCPSGVTQGGPTPRWVGTWARARSARCRAQPGSARRRSPNRAADRACQRRRPARANSPSNAFGREPLLIGRTRIALQGTGANIVAGSDRALTFSGRATVTIAPGAEVLSDALQFTVPPLGNLAVSLYLPEPAAPTWHPFANQSAYLSPAGVASSAPADFTDREVFPIAATVSSWRWLRSGYVAAQPRLGTLVALGDSITDGARSTLEANHRQPDALSALWNDGAHEPQLAVLNEGMIGNRLLHDVAGPNALARLDRDVLARTGVTRALALLGINDIGSPTAFTAPAEAVSAADITLGLSQLVERAHAQHLLMERRSLATERAARAACSPEAAARFWRSVRNAALEDRERLGKAKRTSESAAQLASTVPRRPTDCGKPRQHPPPIDKPDTVVERCARTEPTLR